MPTLFSGPGGTSYRDLFSPRYWQKKTAQRLHGTASSPARRKRALPRR
ncbi:hypothetical protein KCP70_03165 [Salmonella enterica subsp. enterica]|nr:hypothetical protein KCP70_03165 [Salmonella enterica subsp. enterica]